MIFIASGYGQILYLESSSQKNYFVANFTRFVYSNPDHLVFNIGSGVFLQRLVKRIFLRILLGALRAFYGKQIKLIAPHFVNEFSNYIAFSFGDVVYEQVYDGTLNITDLEQREKEMLFDSAERRAKWFFMKYKRYPGRLTGDDAVEFSERHMPSSLMLHEHLSGKSVSYFDFDLVGGGAGGEPGDNAAVFVDQPLELVAGELSVCERILIDYVKRNECRLYIKLHPSMELESSFIRGMKGRLDYELIQSNEPLEMMLKNRRFKHVISLYSTAVINVSMVYRDVECVFVGLSILSERLPRLKQIERMSRELGVDVLN